MNFTVMIFYYLVLWLVKGAFLVLYIAFTRSPRRIISFTGRCLIYVSTILIILSFLTLILLHLLLCIPDTGQLCVHLLPRPPRC